MEGTPRPSADDVLRSAGEPSSRARRRGDHRVTRVRKIGRLLQLLTVNPVEFADRVRAIEEVRLRRLFPTRARYPAESWDAFASAAGAALNADVPWTDDEPGFAATRAMIQRRVCEPAETSSFPAACDADPVLARLCYFLTLALRPAVVIETGVAFGVASACILAALDRIGRGTLVSIDLPPLGVPDAAVGQIVPAELRPRWTLLRGTSTRLLPRVLKDRPPVGLFVHDSLFTRRNASQEYGQVLPHLSAHSAVVANCADLTPAFAELVDRTQPFLHATVSAETKQELIGVAVYKAAPLGSPAASTTEQRPE
jgi:hypothetical protein